jgi:maltose alpha-D-glucosyltransferase/alpha-amylase
MQWSPDRNAGFSKANPQRLYLPPITDPEYHYETINVEAKRANPGSLLWLTKLLIALRKGYQAFSRGDLTLLSPDNKRIFAFLRSYKTQQVLVLANLSRFVQYCRLDLSAYSGKRPIEMFGNVEFPEITQETYPFMLGPHSFYLFTLEPIVSPEPVKLAAYAPVEIPTIRLGNPKELLTQGRSLSRILSLFPKYLKTRRWFAAKARTIRNVGLMEAILLGEAPFLSWLTLLRVDFTEGDPKNYLMILGLVSGEPEETKAPVIARVQLPTEESFLLVDASGLKEVLSLLLKAIAKRRRFKGRNGNLLALPMKTLKGLYENK